MFTDAELEKIEARAANRATAEEIAAAINIHSTTLERRLLRYHGIVLERVRACRLKHVWVAVSEAGSGLAA